MDAVGFLDRGVLQAGRLEKFDELLPGQRTGDTSGPLLHVPASRLIHAGVGDYVTDRKPATRP